MRRALTLGTMLLLVGVSSVAAAPAGKGFLKKLLGKQQQKVLGRDLLRDRALRIQTLKKQRTVFRYTTWSKAQLEARKGLAPGTHMTAKGGPGRSLSPETAKRRYGLPRKPTARETIHLEAGIPIRSGKVLGGQPGYGEITAAKRIPPEAIRRIVPLYRKGARP